MLRWMACGWSFRKTAPAMSGARTECFHLPNHLYPLCILGLFFIVSPPASSPAALAEAGIARDREKARGECLWSPGLMGGLAGGRVRSRNSRGIPKKKSCSLNSGLPGSRVIQRQGKSSSRRLVKKWCKWITKIKISPNL